jgi:HEPN domain-containing protein
MSIKNFSEKPEYMDNGKKSVEPETNWSIWLREAHQYLKAGKNEKKRFDNSILYNLLAMSLEKFVMAILGYNLMLPLNHTFTDLVESLEKVCPLDRELKDTILRLETRQEICSFEDYVRTEISAEDIILLREVVKKTGEIADGICVRSKAPVFL